jgi:hypothetical protein
MRGKQSLLVLLAGLGTVAMLATATSASAGTATFVGKWYTTSFVVRSESTSGNVYSLVGSGTETFAGCLDVDLSGSCDGREPSGTIEFTFVFRGTYDATTFGQLSGGCIHPIVGGTGSFAHTRGVLAFKDDVSTGISYYVGYLRS